MRGAPLRLNTGPATGHLGTPVPNGPAAVRLLGSAVAVCLGLQGRRGRGHFVVLDLLAWFHGWPSGLDFTTGAHRLAPMHRQRRRWSGMGKEAPCVALVPDGFIQRSDVVREVGRTEDSLGGLGVPRGF